MYEEVHLYNWSTTFEMNTHFVSKVAFISENTTRRTRSFRRNTQKLWNTPQHEIFLMRNVNKHSGTITFTADCSRSRNRRVKIKITALSHEAGGKLAVFRKLAWKEATGKEGGEVRHHWCKETADGVSQECRSLRKDLSLSSFRTEAMRRIRPNTDCAVRRSIACHEFLSWLVKGSRC